MADLSEYLKQGLKGILKNKQPNRIERNKLDRKVLRTDMLNAKRRIKDSPLPPTPATLTKGQQVPSRVEILKKWKLERDQRKLEEAAKKKPIFKVCHVPEPTDVGKVYKELKGKPLSKAKRPQSPLKFVGSSHKFNPPTNIKPIPFKATSGKSRTGALESGRVTRSKSQQTMNTARKLNFNSDKQPEVAVQENKNKLKVTKPLIDASSSKDNLKQSKSDRVLRNNLQRVKSVSNDALPIKESLDMKKKFPSLLSKENLDTKKKLPSKNIKSKSTDHLSNKENVEGALTKKVPLKKVKATSTDKSLNKEGVDEKKLPQKKVLSASNKDAKETNRSKKEIEEKENQVTQGIEEKKLTQKKVLSASNKDAKETNRSKKQIEEKESQVTQDAGSKEKKAQESTIVESDCINSEEHNLIIDVNICDNQICDVNESTKPLSLKSDSTSSSLSVEYPIVNVVDTPGNESPVFINSVTPKSKPIECIYVSPFVTMSRGKSKAREEYKSRSSRGGLSLESPESTGSTAGAQYFYKVLDDEITRINGVCDEWNNYKLETNAPEEVCDMINVATGQSNLLISKRMQQFRGLIDSCKAQNTDPLITCGDLHGYWDLLLIQVNNLNLRFDNLVKLRANNWEEILPEKKVPAKKKQVAKRPKQKGSSALREAIKAARAKKNVDTLVVLNVNGVQDVNSVQDVNTVQDVNAVQDVDTFGVQNVNTLQDVNKLCLQNVFDGGFFKVTSPSKLFSKTPAKSRRSLLQNVLTSEVAKRITSPGLMIMRASQTAKIVSENTPAKSILKSVNSKSTGRKSKAVIFKEESAGEEIFESASSTIDEPSISNIVNSENKKDNVRRSTRLTRNKLVF